MKPGLKPILPTCLMIMLVAASCSGFVRAEERPLTYRRAVAHLDSKREELVSLVLDSAIYDVVDSNFHSLRVFDNDDNLVPFITRQRYEQREYRERIYWPAAEMQAQPSDAGLEVTITLKEDQPQPTGIRLTTPLRDFQQQIAIFAVGTPGDEPLAKGMIYDYSRYVDVRHLEIEIPETDARSFRLVIGTLTADQESQALELTRTLAADGDNQQTERLSINRRPFRIDRIDFWQTKVELRRRQPVERPYPLKELVITENDKDSQTIVNFSSQREPLTTLQLHSSSRNFSRRATVEYLPDDASNWQQLTTQQLQRIDFRNIQETKLDVNFPEQRYTKYRLTIENRDAAPLAIDEITAAGHEYEVVFLADPEHTYYLQYGGLDREPVELDTTPLKVILSEDQPLMQLALGAVVPTTATEPLPPLQWKDLLNNPKLFFGIVFILTLLLGWGLFNAAKRVQNLPDDA